MIALVPGVPALLPEHASIDDPVADLRAACRKVAAGLGPRVRVVASGPAAARVGRHLVDEAGATVVAEEESGVLVVGNGSAKRTEKAPGHLDERAEAFDAAVGAALLAPDPAALAAVDQRLAAELWADVGALRELGALLRGGEDVEVAYDAAPYGVQYWVVRWSRG